MPLSLILLFSTMSWLQRLEELSVEVEANLGPPEDTTVEWVAQQGNIRISRPRSLNNMRRRTSHEDEQLSRMLRDVCTTIREAEHDASPDQLAQAVERADEILERALQRQHTLIDHSHLESYAHAEDSALIKDPLDKTFSTYLFIFRSCRLRRVRPRTKEF